jgi:hypothetical protein
MTNYGNCAKCGSLIYRSKATGRAWQHIDYRKEKDHEAVPEGADVEKLKLRQVAKG